LQIEDFVTRRVTAIMKRTPITAAASDPLLEAVARMEANQVRHLPVVDDDGKLIGMISDRDVRGAFGHAWRSLERDGTGRLQVIRVAEVMSRNPLSIDEAATLRDAAQVLAEHHIGALPVIDRGRKVVGILSYVDVLRACLTGETPEMRALGSPA
jgi:CBS domain-containing protein